MSGKYNPGFMKKFVNEQLRPDPVTSPKALNPLPAIVEDPAEREEDVVSIQPPRR